MKHDTSVCGTFLTFLYDFNCPRSEVDVFLSNAFQRRLNRRLSGNLRTAMCVWSWRESPIIQTRKVFECRRSSHINRLRNRWSFCSRSFSRLASSHWHYLITFQSVNYNYFPCLSLPPTANSVVCTANTSCCINYCSRHGISLFTDDKQSAGNFRQINLGRSEKSQMFSIPKKICCLPKQFSRRGKKHFDVCFYIDIIIALQLLNKYYR